MRINAIRLKNFGPHQTLEHTFEAGSVGIFGKNGSGKSTLVDAMYTALTGDFGRFDGNKADCIRLGAGDREQSYVEVDATHNEVDFTIRRDLRPQKNSLTHNGTVITDSKEIAQFMERHGLSKQLLDFAVFKRQNKVFDFLEQTLAVRANAYHSLNKTQNCEKIHELLKKKIATLLPIAAYFDESDDRKKEYDEARRALQDNGAKQAQLTEKLVKKEHLDLAVRAIEDAKQVARIKQEIEDISKDLDTLPSKIKQLTAAKTKVEIAVSTQERQVAVCESKHSEAQARLAVIDANRIAATKAAQAKANIRSLSKAVQPPLDPPKEGFESALAKAHSIVAEAKEDLKTKRAVVAKFSKVGNSMTCPTCGQETKALAALYADAVREAEEADAEQVRVSEILHDLSDQKHLYATWEKDEARRLQRLEAEQRVLDSIGDFEEVDEEEASRLKHSLTVLPVERKNLEHLRSQLGQTSVSLASATARATELEKALNKKLEAIQGLTQTPEDRLAKMVKRLETHRKTEADIAALAAVRKVMVQTMKDAEVRYDKALAQLQRSKTAQQVIARLTRMQEVFHRNVLPRRVAEVNMIRMEQDLNQNLDLFGSPFRVKTAQNLSFTVTPTGELPRPAERLSGGQKTVLAIAFWQAVSKLFGQDIGLLVLDEPTANLDEANVRGLAAAMAAFTASLRGSRQLFMVTHAESLKPAFDTAITIGA